MEKCRVDEVKAEIDLKVLEGQKIGDGTDFEARFFSYEFKDKREWLILGSAASCMKVNGWPYPEFAVKQHPPDPDFRAFFSDGAEMNIEITECLSNGYRRHDYYRGTRQSQADRPRTVPIESPQTAIRILQEAVNKKSTKPYANESILLVYFNMPIIKSLGPDVDVMEALSTGEMSIDTESASYRQILLLSGSLRRLLSLQ